MEKCNIEKCEYNEKGECLFCGSTFLLKPNDKEHCVAFIHKETVDNIIDYIDKEIDICD